MPRIEDDKLEQLVNSAVKLIQPDGSIPLGMTLRFQQLVYLLAHSTRVPAYRDNTPEKQEFVCKVLRGLSGRPSVSRDEFNSALEEEVQRLAQLGTHTYQVLFAANLAQSAADLFKLALEVCPGPLDYELVEAPQAQKRYGIYGNVPRTTPHSFTENLTRFTYCVVHYEAATTDQAIEAAGATFELARAWVNFSLCMFSADFPTVNRQMSRCSPSNLINCYDATGHLVAQKQAAGDYDYTVPMLREGEVARAARFLEHVQTRPRTIVMDRMKSAMILYGQALDETNEAYQFFHLWQALEILLGTGDQEEMRDRMKSLLPANDISAALVEPLIDKRTKLIYQGRIRDFSEEDITMLKNLVDNTLVSILALSEKLRTNRQLEDFWSFWGLHEEELRRKRVVLDQILSTPKYAA